MDVNVCVGWLVTVMKTEMNMDGAGDTCCVWFAARNLIYKMIKWNYEQFIFVWLRVLVSHTVSPSTKSRS